MGKTITVTTTAAQVLRDAARVASDRKGGDRFDRQAAVMYEFGYAMAPTHDDSLGPVVVELPEPDDHEVMEGDEGRSAAIPTWSLHSGALLADSVYAWSYGVDFDGDLTTGEEDLRQLERDALKLLAAIATHRRGARRSPIEGADRG